MSNDHDRGSGSHAGSSEIVGQPAPDPEAGSAAAGNPAANDPLSDVLHSLKLTGALFFLVDATSPWCVDVPAAGTFAEIILPRARHIVSYHVVIRGRGLASVRPRQL